MAKEQNRRLTPNVVSEDQACLASIKTLKDYKPSNADFSLDEVETAGEAVTAAQEKETQAEFAWKSARERAVAAEWEFHNKILGAKSQIIAQYGVDSDQVQGVGLKKKSNYKRGGGRKPALQVLPKAA